MILETPTKYYLETMVEMSQRQLYENELMIVHHVLT